MREEHSFGTSTAPWGLWCWRLGGFLPHKERTSSNDAALLISIRAGPHPRPKLRFSRHPVRDRAFSAHEGMAPDGGSYQTTGPTGSGPVCLARVHTQDNDPSSAI